METIPNMCCVGCGAAACIWNCLRSHNNRSHCHNPRCLFYRACPPDAAPEAPDQAAAPPAGGDTATAAQRREGVPPTDPNVICRETVVREWRLAGGDAAPVTTEQTSTAAAPTPAPTAPAPSPTIPAPPAPADASAPPAADAPRSPAPPAAITVEELETLVELLARFAHPRARRP